MTARELRRGAPRRATWRRIDVSPRAAWLALALTASAPWLAACHGKAQAGPAAHEDVKGALSVKDDSAGLLLTWIDDHGDFHVEQKVTDVPLAGRDAVRVVDPSREDGTHGDKIYVADLRNKGADGTYPLHTSTRAEFEALAEKRREKLGPTLATAQDAATVPRAPNGPEVAANDPTGAPHDPNTRPAVIIYGASWCGACHQAAAYLRQKGVAFVEKDIEEDPAAAREMREKLAKNGLPRGSIPVIDVRGKVMVGFNPESMDEALGQAL